MHSNKLLILLLFCSLFSFGQQEEFIRQVMEKYTENADQEFDYQDLHDQLTQLTEHKINLNTADRIALQKIFFLSPMQVNAILDHKRRFGAFLNLYELQVINELDDETLKNILPFVSVSTQDYLPKSLHELLKTGNHVLVNQFETDLPLGKAYHTDPLDEKANANHYQGNPLRWVMRYRYSFKSNLQFGFTSEKDAGEPFLTSFNKQGFDFYSAHALYRSTGFLKALAIGDYQLSFGQMLTIGTGLAFGKSAQVLNTKRNFNGLRPYRSVNETSFLRGAAATIGKGNFTVTPYYSRVWQDANLITLDSGLIDENEAFSSFYLSGYHRTFNEYAKKKKLLMQTFGVNSQYRRRNLTLGITYNQINLSKPLQSDIKIYNTFYERGSQFSKVGLYYDYYYLNFNLYGESSFDLNGAQAHVHGMMASLGKILDINLFYRKYDPAFTTLQSNGIGENSVNRNEEGLYLGGVLKWNKKLSLTGYYDIFRFPFARYLAESPSVGKEFLAELSYKPNRRTLLYLRLREETKDKNLSGYAETPQGTFTRRNLRFHADYEAAENIQFKTRVELSEYYGPGKAVYGSVIYQDITLKTIPRTSITTRIAFFNIDHFDARIYAYENDVPYSYSIPAFLNSGGRVYVMARYNIKRGLDIWGRMANTFYSNANSFGSGNDLIAKPHKTNISLLIKWSF